MSTPHPNNAKVLARHPDPAVVMVHDYSTPNGSPFITEAPTLVIAPQALHDAALADLAPQHSLMERLQQEGLRRLSLVEWISATTETADHSIASQLLILDQIVDLNGSRANLIGLCQGGWLSLAYAALFPHKVRRLVMAGSPVDFHAGLKFNSDCLGPMPWPQGFAGSLNVFGLSPWLDFWCTQLTGMTNPIICGRDIRWLWPYALDQDWQIADTLQIPPSHPPALKQAALKALKGWDQRMLDLPGPYFWEVVHWLYRDNRLARGLMRVMGRLVDLKSVTCPLYLLAGEHDTIVHKSQLLATEQLVGTAPALIRTAIAPCGHLGLFMGYRTLKEFWPSIVAWLINQRPGRTPL